MTWSGWDVHALGVFIAEGLVASVFNPTTRAALHRRMTLLTPEPRGRWGQLSAHQMICHLSDQLRMGLGELPTRPVPGPLRYTPIKQLVINVIPWPRGVVSPVESFTTAPVDWQRDLAALGALLDRLAARSPNAKWPDHPMFGPMSGSLWGQLTARHFDHHFRQFGV